MAALCMKLGQQVDVVEDVLQRQVHPMHQSVDYVQRTRSIVEQSAGDHLAFTVATARIHSQHLDDVMHVWPIGPQTHCKGDWCGL